jgi:hypothetical protein
MFEQSFLEKGKPLLQICLHIIKVACIFMTLIFY